jgi:glycosyltransferase involved in cell wall biosynthesis
MQENARYRLLTVGRFSYPKNMDNIPDLCRRIRKAGIDIIWYLIGYGSEEDEIKQKINEFGMKNYVIILGKKTNPYPYMSRCDVYVQPSR